MAVIAKQCTLIHDGDGLYLRTREGSALKNLRLTEPATVARQWYRMFPDDPVGGNPHRSLSDARIEAKRMLDLGSASPRSVTRVRMR